MAAILVPQGAAGQETNADILERLAVECVQPVAEPYTTIVLNPDPVNPFLNQAIISALRDNGKDLFLASETAVYDTTSLSPAEPLLTFFLEGATVDYRKKGRRTIDRSVGLRLSYLLTNRNSRVIADSTCFRSFSDEIAYSDLDAVETESIPLTKGKRPRQSWIRRYAEPIVVAGATAVAVYLFFNVRSDSNDSP
jgi:hypothetical protein